MVLHRDVIPRPCRPGLVGARRRLASGPDRGARGQLSGRWRRPTERLPPPSSACHEGRRGWGWGGNSPRGRCGTWDFQCDPGPDVNRRRRGGQCHWSRSRRQPRQPLSPPAHPYPERRGAFRARREAQEGRRGVSAPATVAQTGLPRVRPWTGLSPLSPSGLCGQPEGSGWTLQRSPPSGPLFSHPLYSTSPYALGPWALEYCAKGGHPNPGCLLVFPP